MGIESIGGATAVGASSVGSSTRSSSYANTDVQVADVPGTRQQKIDNITVNSAKNNSSGGAQSGSTQEDKTAVQGTQNVSKEDVLAAVDDLNKQVKQYSNIKHTSLSFKYHDETNRISITVTDDDTDEVIREIPAEKALDMLAKAWEMAGLLVDEKR
jgi:flagellar protein FlaG